MAKMMFLCKICLSLLFRCPKIRLCKAPNVCCHKIWKTQLIFSNVFKGFHNDIDSLVLLFKQVHVDPILANEPSPRHSASW